MHRAALGSRLLAMHVTQVGFLGSWLVNKLARYHVPISQTENTKDEGTIDGFDISGKFEFF